MSDHTRADEGEGREPTTTMIAAAWGAWRVRHPTLRLGPGPGFREAIKAALLADDRAAQAEAEVARLTAALAEAERQRDEAKSDEESAWRDKEAAICAVSRRCLDLEASASALRERVATLEAALKPFCFGDATMEQILFGSMPDSAPCNFTIKYGHLRAARIGLEARHADN